MCTLKEDYTQVLSFRYRESLGSQPQDLFCLREDKISLLPLLEGLVRFYLWKVYNKELIISGIPSNLFLKLSQLNVCSFSLANSLYDVMVGSLYSFTLILSYLIYSTIIIF